jgi:hypothetical protein
MPAPPAAVELDIRDMSHIAAVLADVLLLV